MPEVLNIKPVHEDDRGKIIDVVDGDTFVHAGICTFKKGAVRGNHYHKKTEQVNYILSGKIKYLSRDLTQEGAPVEESIIGESDTVVSKPGEWHSMEAVEDSVLLFFTKDARLEDGYEDDTFRIPLEEIKDFSEVVSIN